MEYIKYQEAQTVEEYAHTTRLSGKLITNKNQTISVLGTKECEIITKALNDFYNEQIHE